MYVGKIVFESLENDNNIVIFSYDNGKKGYFDVEKNLAIFEEYHRPWESIASNFLNLKEPLINSEL